ncbi:MAG: DUF222 domain-containing protein [Microthrixaceae bacterium]
MLPDGSGCSGGDSRSAGHDELSNSRAAQRFDRATGWKCARADEPARSGDDPPAGEGCPELDELVAIHETRRRLEHRESALLAEMADRGTCDALHGHPTGMWLAHRTRQSRAAANRQVRTAQRLHTRYQALAQAFEDGIVGWQHVRVFDQVANQRIWPAMVDLLPRLIDLAKVATFDRWAQEVRGIAELLDQDGGYDPARDPANNRLSLIPTTDGVTHISGQLVGELAPTITKLLEAETDKVLTRHRSDAERSDGEIPVPSRAQAAAEALGELVDRGSGVADGEGRLPEPEIVVVYNADTGELTDDNDRRLSPEIMRFIIAAGLIRPAHLTRTGDPLTMGHTLRYANRQQRRALLLRDGGCVFPGCDRPPSWCDAHHVDCWDDNGPTDLNNLALLCRHHHRVTHRPGWTMSRDHDNPEQVTFRWRTPTGRLIESQRHRLEGGPTTAA